MDRGWVPIGRDRCRRDPPPRTRTRRSSESVPRPAETTASHPSETNSDVSPAVDGRSMLTPAPNFTGRQIQSWVGSTIKKEFDPTGWGEYVRVTSEASRFPDYVRSPMGKIWHRVHGVVITWRLPPGWGTRTPTLIPRLWCPGTLSSRNGYLWATDATIDPRTVRAEADAGPGGLCPVCEARAVADGRGCSGLALHNQRRNRHTT